MMKSFAVLTWVVSALSLAAPVGTSTTSGSVSGMANTLLSVGPAIHIQGADKARPGLNFTAVTSAAPSVPLYVGVDAGFFFNSDPKFNGFLPVLGTMYYEFQTGAPTRPVLGVAAGPVFGIGETGASSAEFGMLLKPALHIRMAPTVGLAIESRIGVFGSTFVYLPQVAATFVL